MAFLVFLYIVSCGAFYWGPSFKTKRSSCMLLRTAGKKSEQVENTFRLSLSPVDVNSLLMKSREEKRELLLKLADKPLDFKGYLNVSIGNYSDVNALVGFRMGIFASYLCDKHNVRDKEVCLDLCDELSNMTKTQVLKYVQLRKAPVALLGCPDIGKSTSLSIYLHKLAEQVKVDHNALEKYILREIRKFNETEAVEEYNNLTSCSNSLPVLYRYVSRGLQFLATFVGNVLVSNRYCSLKYNLPYSILEMIKFENVIADKALPILFWELSETEVIRDLPEYLRIVVMLSNDRDVEDIFKSERKSSGAGIFLMQPWSREAIMHGVTLLNACGTPTDVTGSAIEEVQTNASKRFDDVGGMMRHIIDNGQYTQQLNRMINAINTGQVLSEIDKECITVYHVPEGTSLIHHSRYVDDIVSKGAEMLNIAQVGSSTTTKFDFNSDFARKLVTNQLNTVEVAKRQDVIWEYSRLGIKVNCI